MPSVNYGTREIEWSFEERPQQLNHYISVQKVEGVVLTGPPLAEAAQSRLIREKARWIAEKLELVAAAPPLEIVGGGQIPYLDRRYYIHLQRVEGVRHPEIHFRGAQFEFRLPPEEVSPNDLQRTLQRYYLDRIRTKFPPRIRQWIRRTGLTPTALQFRQMEKRWASCTPENKLVFNTRCVQLPWRLIDYLIVHELAHTVVKDHSARFWSEVEKWMPDWAKRDEELGRWRV